MSLSSNVVPFVAARGDSSRPEAYRLLDNLMSARRRAEYDQADAWFVRLARHLGVESVLDTELAKDALMAAGFARIVDTEALTG